jgi:hypothetical protein
MSGVTSKISAEIEAMVTMVMRISSGKKNKWLIARNAVSHPNPVSTGGKARYMLRLIAAFICPLDVSTPSAAPAFGVDAAFGAMLARVVEGNWGYQAVSV